MKRKSESTNCAPPLMSSDPKSDTDDIMRWGKRTGEICLTPMKTYATNQKERKLMQDREKENIISLKKLTRMQIISCIIQLEEKTFIECPMKGCRCISMSVSEIADHIDSCEGVKSNKKLKMCKYCPHGTLATKSLRNHVVVSHPYAIEVQAKDCLQYDNSVNDAMKTKFLTSNVFKQTIKNHWRVYLESKGCIMCLIPCCHYVTGFISQMETHFLLCGPDLWEKLTFSCDQCAGRTFSEEELNAHFADCHSADFTYNCGDEKLKGFWELTLQAFEVSKCVSKNCKFIAHNIISLEKHYRYCRNPREENFEICPLCGGWFDNTYDLWHHETHFHVIGKGSKVKKLLSIDVNSPGTSWLMKKLATRTTHTHNPSETPEDSRKAYFKDVVLNKTSFLGELAKTIESEGKNALVDIRVTVENQFSWSMKAPNLKTATEVVNRRLPSYSVKRIMAESIEDGARLLKLSETVASIACNSSKTYIPPRPLDFVVDCPNALPSLRKKFVAPKPVVPKVTTSELSVQSKSQAEDKKCTVPSTKKKTNSVKRSQNETHKPKAKKSKCGGNKRITPKGVRTLLPVKPKAPNQVPKPPTIKVYYSKRALNRSRTPFGNEANGSNGVPNNAVVEASNDLNNSPKLALDHEVIPSGTYMFAEKESILRYCHLLNKRSANTLNSNRLQYPSAKGSARSTCLPTSMVEHLSPSMGENPSPSMVEHLSPSMVKHPQLASILLQPGGKSQTPSSLKLVRLVPSNKLGAANPITQYLPVQRTSSIVKNPKFISPNNEYVAKNDSPEIEGLNYNLQVDPLNENKDSNDGIRSYSSIPFELPILPPIKSIIFGESNPISDYPHEMASRGSPENSSGPDIRNQHPRTYGKNGYSTQSPRNSLIVQNGMVADKDHSCMGVESGLFVDMDVDNHDSECVEDPLNIEPHADIEVKTEPIESPEDIEPDDPSVMFYENYDIFATKGEGVLSPPYDTSIPFDIICESSQAVSGGLYNDRCPWEQAKTKRSSDRNSNNLRNKNSQRSEKLLENSVCDPRSSTLFGTKEEESLTCSNHRCNLEKPNHDVKVENADNEEDQGLANYLTNANGAHFVNEPMIYTVDKIIYDNPPKLSDLRTNRMESVKATCSKDIRNQQSCLLTDKEGALSGSDDSSNLDKPNHCAKVEIADNNMKSSNLDKPNHCAKVEIADNNMKSSNLDKPNHCAKVDIADSNMKEFQELVNYLTKFTGPHFVNKPMIYAVDKIIYDNPPKMSGLRKNGTESKKARRGRSSSSDIPPEQNCSQNVSSGQQDNFSDQSALPAASSKSDGRMPEKSHVSHLPASNDDEALASSKRKRKSNSSKLSKGLSNEKIGLEKSSKVLSSLGEVNLSNEGGLVVDDTEEDDVGTGAGTSSNREEVTPKRRNIAQNDPCETSAFERPESAVHSEGPTVPSKVSGGKRTARKSARIVEGTDESLTDRTITKKRSRRVINIHSVEEIAPGIIVPLSEENESEEEKKLPKKKGRPPKRKSKSILNGLNVPKSTFSQEAGHRSSTPESILYIPGDNDPESDILVPANQRIIFNSPLVDPLKLVECAVCGESMTAAVYKKEHVLKHNHLCWLKGEEPMDLDDEKGVERFLYRVYLKTRAPFICEICGVSKKSALGFLTHRKFCGKSVQERKELMVSCSICSRVLLPSSLHNHMIKTHPAIASAPEDPPLEGRLAASKCLDALSANVKDIRDNLQFIDENEELQAVDKNSWIRQAYSFCKRRVQKDQKSLIEGAAQGDEKFRCSVTGCNFSDTNIINVIEHYKVCDMEPLDCRCKECTFITNSETRMINHIRMNHFDKAKEYASKEYRSSEIIDVSEVPGAFIPYVKSGELGCRSMLYLQPALYWTKDLREEHLSIDPLFTDWEVAENLDLKKIDEFASHLRLRDESIRFKPGDDQSEWSVMKKFACKSFNDDVRILYTGGVVRTFDWFPSSTSHYLAVSVASIDSDSIPARPVHSGPGHFQIWSAGTLDNFSETYEVDLHLYLAVCHEFGEIWDLECCPSGAQTDKRLGLVAIGTSSGIVAVYSIPFLEASSEKRAISLDPVMTLKLGTRESFQVSKISWSKTKPHRFVAAGFTNGLVAVWDLTTTSSLLKSGNTILPFKSFHPHLAIITALSFSPVNEYYIATGCAEKSSKFWNLQDTSVNHGEFTRGLVTDVAWLPHWMAAVNSLDDNYTTGTTTVILNSIRNFIYQSQPGVTQADSTGISISVNNWLNTFVVGYDSGQIILSIARKYNQHHNEDRRKVFNCLLSPQLHDFDPNSSKTVACNSYSSTCERFGIIFNHNFQMNNQTKIKGNPAADLQCFPVTPVNKVCWNPNPNSFLTLASGFHSGFIIVSRVKLPTMEINLLKSIFDNFNTKVSS